MSSDIRLDDTKNYFICGLISGLYACSFNILNNLAMFSTSTILLVLLAIVIPPILVSVVIGKFFVRTKLKNYAYAFCAWFCISWILFFLHEPVKSIPLFNSLFSNIHWFSRYFMLVLVPGFVGGWLFRKNIKKLSVVLTAMLVTAIALNINQITSRVGNENIFRNKSDSGNSVWFKPVETPNIYFILADGLASFKYLRELGFPADQFVDHLEDQTFVVYEDTFANIHPTLLSMASILNFQLVESGNWETARQVISNPIELKHNLKSAGYGLEYFHMADYLLLRGCSADTCFPQLNKFKEAQAMLSRIRGKKHVAADWSNYVDHDTLLDQIEISLKTHDTPMFRYVHSYYPAHSPNNVRASCNKELEIVRYKKRVEDELDRLKLFIDGILAEDPNSIIILSSDHGPWISNNCTWHGIPDSVSGVRDRIGAAIAVKWPKTYDNRFDSEIFSTVNLIKYVMASLNDHDSKDLRFESEDLYVLDKRGRPTLIVKDKDLSSFTGGAIKSSK